METIQLSERSQLKIYDDGFAVIAAGQRSHLDSDELAALKRYLVVDALKELEEEVQEKIRTLLVNKCVDCNGTGIYNVSPFRDCHSCSGTGEVGSDKAYKDGLTVALSLIRAKLKGGEDGAK